MLLTLTVSRLAKPDTHVPMEESQELPKHLSGPHSAREELPMDVLLRVEPIQ